jgi:hypothetical protein
MPGSRLRRARSARCMRDGLKTHSVQNRFTMCNEVFNRCEAQRLTTLSGKTLDLPRIKLDGEGEFKLLRNEC